MLPFPTPIHTLYGFFVLAAPILAPLACILAATAITMLVLVRRRFVKLALGRNGSLEESVTILSREVKELKTFRTEIEKHLKLVEARLQGSFQGYGVVRFNPFSGDGSGGNQSFAIAFLDERHNGVVLSTLYARDRVGVYAKPIEKGISTYELTEEEQDALEKAKQAISAHKTPRKTA